MNDNVDPLSTLLAELPPPAPVASPDFTARVLARYEGRRRRRRGVAGVLAAALLLAVTAILWLQFYPEDEMQPQLETLQAEQQRLTAELEELEELAAATRPVAWVWEGEELEVVLDLRHAARGTVLPAGMREP